MKLDISALIKCLLFYIASPIKYLIIQILKLKKFDPQTKLLTLLFIYSLTYRKYIYRKLSERAQFLLFLKNL